MSEKEQELRRALDRADKLVDHMMSYVGQMAPGGYSAFYQDMNEHGIFMARLRAKERK
jgi:hypothetical protein